MSCSSSCASRFDSVISSKYSSIRSRRIPLCTMANTSTDVRAPTALISRSDTTGTGHTLNANTLAPSFCRDCDTACFHVVRGWLPFAWLPLSEYESPDLWRSILLPPPTLRMNDSPLCLLDRSPGPPREYALSRAAPGAVLVEIAMFFTTDAAFDLECVRTRSFNDDLLSRADGSPSRAAFASALLIFPLHLGGAALAVVAGAAVVDDRGRLFVFAGRSPADSSAKCIYESLTFNGVSPLPRSPPSAPPAGWLLPASPFNSTYTISAPSS
mmetsp:Transcript_16290/g.35330  ORF Transcript_16290/g.35330 Transcript_16290/m.35330 type:complete len:270 (-) Transcript_16290:1048-1857(-)